MLNGCTLLGTHLLSLVLATVRNKTGCPCLQIAPRMRAHALLPTLSGRVAVTHLNLTGRILIGLHLFSRAPGIKGLEVSFITPPELDVKFSPFGVTVTEIPGVLSALKVRVACPGIWSTPRLWTFSVRKAA